MPPTACNKEIIQRRLLIKDNNEMYLGGNQEWLRALGNDYIADCGCGLVAVCNVLMCLLKEKYNSESATDKETFINFVKNVNKDYLKIPDIPFIKGLTGFGLAKGINRYFKDNNMPFTSKWGGSFDILPKVKETLNRGMPVILGIGPDILPFFRRFLSINSLKNTLSVDIKDIKNGNIIKVSAHYVVIYDFKEENSDIILYISSWGRGYTLSYKDFISYQKQELFGGLLSNILEISDK